MVSTKFVTQLARIKANCVSEDIILQCQSIILNVFVWHVSVVVKVTVLHSVGGGYNMSKFL